MPQRFASRPSLLRSVLAVLALALAPAALFAANPVIARHVPELVTNGTAKLIAPMAATEKLHLAISLPLRNQAQLDALLADLYNPTSPNFHHWLTPQEFDIQFGPTRAETAALVDWAKDQGMTVTFQATNGRVIEVDSSVETINKAFHVTLQTYHDSNLNRDFHAPDREPTTDLPFALMGVDNLENSAPITHQLKKDPAADLPMYVAAPKPGFIRPGQSPITPHVAGSGPDSSYLPSDMRAAYYGSGNLDGSGQTVGIFSFDGYKTSDLTVYYQNTGMVTAVPVNNVLVGTYSGTCFGSNGTSGTCDDGEQVLDIVQVQGMAPGLKQILFYESTSATSELNQMASDNLAKVITSSWGGGNFGTASDPAFQQMATQGQTYLNATGDSGAFNFETYSAPSLDANIVQVGGTQLVTTGPGGAWSSETGWSDSGGGYYKTLISPKVLIPTWQSQTGVVTSTNKASATYRNSPDIAAEADFDNPTADNGAFEIGYGGTSFATPRMAGYIALANQQSVANGGTTLGFINPALYTAGLSASAATVYHDITSGTNPAAAGGGSYTAVAGYDLVTGWGSPNGTGLINALAGLPPADFGVPTSVSLSTVKGGSGLATISITGYNGYSGSVIATGISGLPSGWSAVYQAGSTSTPLKLYLGAPSTATPGNFTVVVTLADSNNSALSHNVNVLVSVEKRSGGDFTIGATASSAYLGSKGTSTVTVTAGTGLAGGITLAVSNLPPGVSASLSTTATPPDVYTAQNITLTFTVPGSVTPGSYNVTVTGTAVNGITHTATVPLTVSTPPSLIVNGGFETGTAAPWVFTTVSGTQPVSLLTSSSGIPPHTGTYFMLLDGGTAAGVDTATQQVTITSGSKATLGVWYWVLTGVTGTTASDTLTLQLTNTSGTVLTTLATLSNLSAGGYWAYASFDVSAYIGQTVVVSFNGTQTSTKGTDFLIDDVSLVVQ